MKYLKIGIYELSAVAIILFGALLRLVLIFQGWPLTNSDEDTIGIMALHIAYHGEHPIFFYGQHYMGALEAYLGAALFHLFGPTLFSLRLGLVLLFTLFLLSTYLLTHLLFSKPLALLTIALLAIGGSRYVLARELSAIGGYPETLLFGSLAFLFASWLVISYNRVLPLRKQGRRLLIYTCWGLVVGLGLWSDLLIIPFVLLSGLLILLFCWRELLHVLATVCTFLGFVIGAAPLIIYNLNASPGEDSFTTLKLLQRGGGVSMVYTKALLLKEVSNTIKISVPMMTGNPFCPVSELAFLDPTSQQTLQCTFVRSTWGIGYLLLFAVAVLLTVWVVWKGWRQLRTSSTIAEKQFLVRLSARLLLLAAGAFALLLYTFSAAPIDWPGIHSRYIIGLLIATPAVIWPLWSGIENIRSLYKRTTQESLLLIPASPFSMEYRRDYLKPTFVNKMAAAFSVGVLAWVFIVCLVGIGITFHDVPAIQAANRQEEELIHDLLHAGITHIYIDYWGCNKIALISREQIICGVIDGNLQLAHNRTPHYYDIVHADPHSAYVYHIDSEQTYPGSDSGNNASGMGSSFNGRQLSSGELKLLKSGAHYERFILDGYVIYRPL